MKLLIISSILILIKSSHLDDSFVNVISNNCEFDIIRIKREEIMCADYGIYQKYCEHYSLPYEFTIQKERGLGNKDVYTIKPSAIFEESYNNKKKLADFHYNFLCDKLDNEAKLLLYIVPTNEKSPATQFYEFIIVFIFLILVFLIISHCNLPNDFNNSFSNGYILGSISNNKKKRIYCE